MELELVNKYVTTLYDIRIIIKSKICYFEIMFKLTLFFSFLLSVLGSFSQVIEEVIQIDTVTQIIKVIYKPTIKAAYYFNKVAVFANDTSQIAIEKSYNNYGQNGLYKVYYPSGRLKIKTIFANNKINGEWTYYDYKGVIIIKGIYRNGVKHGYWAYKSLRIFGRYKKGLKNKKWKRIDENEKKYISHYKNGVLTRGEGFGNEEAIILHETDSVKIVTQKGGTINDYNEEEISKEHQQAISFLTNNLVFRRTIKKHFGGGIKKYFKNEKFQFMMSSEIISSSMETFLKESQEGKIIVEKIDSLLKNEKNSLKKIFTDEKIKENQALPNYSTKTDSQVEIVFSETNINLLRINVVWNKKGKKQKFQILLYFNDEGVLKGAEYEKP